MQKILFSCNILDKLCCPNCWILQTTTLFFIISSLVQLKCINVVYIYFLELLSEKRYFCKGSPIKSTVAISNGDFRLCGIVMGMSILQGGPPPNFMTHAVSCFFTGCELTTSDVKNLSYQDIVTCVSFIVIC